MHHVTHRSGGAGIMDGECEPDAGAARPGQHAAADTHRCTGELLHPAGVPLHL